MFKPLIKSEVLELSDTLNYSRAMTLSEALNSVEYNVSGMSVIIRDRGNATFQTALTADVTPNGFTIIQSTAVPTISFVLMVQGAINVRHVGVTGVGDVNDSPAFQFLGNLEVPVEGNQGDKYLLESKVTLLNKNVHFNIKGGEFIESTVAGQTFQITNNHANEVNVLALVNEVVGSTLVTKLTLASSTAYVVGDVIKVTSEDRIRPTAATVEDKYVAEFSKVIAKDNSTITLHTSLNLIDAGSTNIRAARLVPRKCSFTNALFSMATQQNSYTDAYHVACEGYIEPELHNLKAVSGAGHIVKTVSCFRALSDKIEGGKILGTGVMEYGSQESNWYDISVDECEHAYNTGSQVVSLVGNDPLMKYGGAVRCRVWNGKCANATDYAWTTGNSAYEVVFGRIRALSCKGFEDHGVGTLVESFTYHGDTSSHTEHDDLITFGTDSDNCKVRVCSGYGDSLKVSNATNAEDSSFHIGTLNIYSDYLTQELIDLNTSATVKIGELNYHIAKDTASLATPITLVTLDGTGLFYLTECNVFANSGSTQIVNCADHTFIEVNAANHKGVFATFNIHCGVSTATDLANSIILEANSNKIISGLLSINVFVENSGFDRDRAVISNIGADSNVLFNYKVHTSIPNGVSKYDSSIGSQSITTATNALAFGPSGYPWNITTNKYSHQKLVKHFTSNSDTHQITSIAKPAFDGQEFVLHVPASSNSFVIIGDCPGMHTDWSGSNVTFTAGASYSFISRWDSTESEYLWDYLG